MREQPQRLPVKKYFLFLSIGLLTVLPFPLVQAKDPLLEPIVCRPAVGVRLHFRTPGLCHGDSGWGILHQYPLYTGCAEDVFRSNYCLRNLHIVEGPSD